MRDLLKESVLTGYFIDPSCPVPLNWRNLTGCPGSSYTPSTLSHNISDKEMRENAPWRKTYRCVSHEDSHLKHDAGTQAYSLYIMFWGSSTNFCDSRGALQISDTKKSRAQQWECSKELWGELGQEGCTITLESWLCKLTGNQVMGKLVHLTEHSVCAFTVWIIAHCGLFVELCNQGPGT